MNYRDGSCGWMLRSGRFADRLVTGHQALQQLIVDELVVDAVANRLLSVGEYGVLLFHRSIISRGWGLQPFRPAAGAVVDAHDLDRGAAQAVGYDVGGFGYDEFARAGNTSCCPKLRVFRKKMLYAVENVQGDALCGSPIMLGDVGAKGNEVVNGFGRPCER